MLRSLVNLGFGITTLLSIAVSAVAQFTPPAGVTIPQNNRDTIEQTIPLPSKSSSPLPTESPALSLEPKLETPAT